MCTPTFGQVSAIANVDGNRDWLFAHCGVLQSYVAVLLVYPGSFSSAGYVIPRPISFLVFLFDSFNLKWCYARIICIFFWKWIKRKNNYIHFPIVCLSINNGGTSGNCNITSCILPSLLNQIAALGSFLVMNTLKHIIVIYVNFYLCISVCIAQRVVKVANIESDTRNRFSP